MILDVKLPHMSPQKMSHAINLYFQSKKEKQREQVMGFQKLTLKKAVERKWKFLLLLVPN